MTFNGITTEGLDEDKTTFAYYALPSKMYNWARFSSVLEYMMYVKLN